ncbi:ABC transporter ATP-binding protein [Pseudomonas sp. 21LCFQ02]|uniref:ABC transporter ATP-binding protein n=1 Tax=unclassified Pseudomonas TaxID=196821 RepID=UPI0004F8A7B7|nr:MULTISPECIES: ABC transporter ATP-binding protein [unclassified Pseudomonas]MCO8169463.1 ABC transporter ATP-binding protein [Pseudomonas sp. 21LCFQ02]BAP45301.1 ABC transporter [Pseudomonas sp. StFLB209]
MPEALLQIRDLSVHYGAIEAVNALSLNVAEGEHVTLIGANGAGKTSTLKALTGLLTASAGTIHFDGQPLHSLGAHQRLQRGLAMVPEGRGVFARMSVLENLHTGAYLRRDTTAIADQIERILDWFPHLRRRLEQPAGLLSGGEQQMLALGRALMSRPRLLVLDEPSMGLAPVMVEKIFAVISEVCRSGMTLLLVEQNARLALQVTERGYVMDSGRITLQGASRELLEDPQVRAAYLGE